MKNHSFRLKKNERLELTSDTQNLCPGAIEARKIFLANPGACFEDANGRIYGFLKDSNSLDIAQTPSLHNISEMWILVPCLRTKTALTVDMDEIQRTYRPPICNSRVGLWRAGTVSKDHRDQSPYQVEIRGYQEENRRLARTFRARIEWVHTPVND